MNTPSAPAVGQRVTIDGIEYFVTHVTIYGNNKQYNGGDTPADVRIKRAQIDLTPVEEVKARHANLTALLDG